MGDVTLSGPALTMMGAVLTVLVGAIGALFRELMQQKDTAYVDMRANRDFARTQFDRLQDTVSVQQQALALQIALIREGMGVVQASMRSMELLVQGLAEERRERR